MGSLGGSAAEGGGSGRDSEGFRRVQMGSEGFRSDSSGTLLAVHQS